MPPLTTEFLASEIYVHSFERHAARRLWIVFFLCSKRYLQLMDSLWNRLIEFASNLDSEFSLAKFPRVT
jgi:hypothetical protein